MQYRRTALLYLFVLMLLLVPVKQTFAAVSFSGFGADAEGTNSIAIEYPTGEGSVSAGDLLIMGIVSKRPSSSGPSVPSGWTAVANGQVRGGNGSTGTDSGEVYATVYVKVADGTETGTVTVTQGSHTGACMVGAIASYSKASDEYWDYAAAIGTDSTASGTWFATASSNPGITAGDIVVAVSGVNSDGYSFISESMSATDATFSNHDERSDDSGTSDGDDCELLFTDHTVSSGTASAAPTLSASNIVSSSVAPTGGVVFLRIRDASVTGGAGDGVTFTAGDVIITASTSVAGTLAKGSGSFVIDHPLDPLNKLLYHFFVESPDVKNIYDGVVELDRNGEATIELPGYFLALNKDFRYLATPIGQPMPDLYLAEEVRSKWFGLFGSPVITISGGAPGGRISWQVTGVRKDPFILARPIVTEVDKGPDEIVSKGEYICEECY